MSQYECVFVARQDLSQSQTETLTETYTKVLSDNKAKVANHEYWGLKNLAYPIKKNKRGHYVMLNVEGPSEAIQEMERQMRFNEDVIRYLSIKVDAFQESPSIMMRQQERDRDFGGKDKFSRDRGDRNERYSPPRSDAPKKEEVKDASE